MLKLLKSCVAYLRLRQLRLYRGMAQLVAQKSPKLPVVGSSPTAPAYPNGTIIELLLLPVLFEILK